MRQLLIEAEHLFLAYKRSQVLSNVSFHILAGERVQIQGFNGEGKTTLIKALLGLLQYKGSLKLDGKEVREYTPNQIKKYFSYLPQRLETIPRISVSDFLSLYSTDAEIKEESVRITGIAPLLSVPMGSLSLGQLQLVLLSRSLLSDSDICVFDEPLSSIDVENKNLIYDIIKSLSYKGKTVILISHEIDSRFNPDRIITLSNSKVYTTGVIVKNKQLKDRDRIRDPRLLFHIILVSILLILSFIVPGNTTPVLRTLWAILSGSTLSMAGAVFQILLQNPLASPYTLGLASGSAIGALAAFLIGFTSIFPTTLCSLIGGITTLFLLLIIPRDHTKDNSFVLLSGIAYASFITSISMLMQSYVDTQAAYSYMRWMLGGLDIDWYSSLSLTPLIIAPLFILYRKSNIITSLGIDTDIAHTSGIHYSKERNIVLALSTIAISTVVSQTGPLSFVGLVIPNIIRRIYGDSLKRIFFVTILSGISFTLLSDLLTRLCNLNNIPLTTGVVMSLLGSPFLIYILYRTHR